MELPKSIGPRLSEILDEIDYNPNLWLRGDQFRSAMERLVTKLDDLKVAPDSFLSMSSSLGETRIVVHYIAGIPAHYSVQYRPSGTHTWVHYEVLGDGTCGPRSLELAKRLLCGEEVCIGQGLYDNGWRQPLVKAPQLVMNEALEPGGDATQVWGIVHDDEAFARKLQEAEGGGPPPVQAAVGASVPTPGKVAAYGATDTAEEAISLVREAENREAEALTKAYFKQLAHDREQEALQMADDAAIAAALAAE